MIIVIIPIIMSMHSKDMIITYFTFHLFFQVEMQYSLGPMKISLLFLMMTRLVWLYTFCLEELPKKLVKKIYYLTKISGWKQMLVLLGVPCSLCLKAKLTVYFPHHQVLDKTRFAIFMLHPLMFCYAHRRLVFAESTLMFAINGNQIGFAKLVQGFRLSTSDGHYIPTKAEGKKLIKLKMNEIVLQVIS